MRSQTRPISVTRQLGAADPIEVRSGPSIPPIERIKLFSDGEWESVRRRVDVEPYILQAGGNALVAPATWAATSSRPSIRLIQNGPWDNFQCKHYDHPLAPSDIWLELGKLCYFTHLGEYSIPRQYYFVAPRGVGTKLLRAPGKSQMHLRPNSSPNGRRNARLT